MFTDLRRTEMEIRPGAEVPSLRPTVGAMEEAMAWRFDVLDHGFVRVVDYMGDDAAVVQAARVSYGAGTKATSEDRGLIRYLMRHRHSTPFEMCEIKLHVKLPIFVARQWIRHRMANVNEMSARYSILDNEFYLPAPEAIAAQSSSNKQGRGDVFGAGNARDVQLAMRRAQERDRGLYLSLLNETVAGEWEAQDGLPGMARELARTVLPVSAYTQWYWKVDLHNLFNFLSLRADPHAQLEIRAYADVILKIVEAWVPMAAEAFREYRLGAFSLSASMLQVVRRIAAGEPVTQATSGLAGREWRELAEAIGLPAGSASQS